MVLDAETGSEIWARENDNAGGWWASNLVSAGGGQAVTVVDETLHLVDLATGDTSLLTERLLSGVALSGFSDDWIVAWASRTDDDALLLTRDRTNGESRGEYPVPEKSEVITIDAAGYIWMYDSDRNVTFAVDCTGAQRTEEISGRLVVIGDGTLVVQKEDRSYQVWSFEAA